MRGDGWKHVRTALRDTGDRFAELVRTSSTPEALATKGWTVREVAVHTASLSWLACHVVAPDEVPLMSPEVAAIIPTTTNDTVADFNDVTMRHFTERDIPTVAKRLTSDLDHLLSLTRDRDPEETVAWLGGSRVPIAGVVAHMLNELQIHGLDIANAVRTPWTVEPGDAAHFFELFLTGVTRSGYGRLLDNGARPRERRIVVEFQSPHTTPIAFRLHRGFVTVEPPGPDPDVRMRFDPFTLNLVLFGRVSKARAVLTRKLVISGPRPWLLAPFLRKVRLPS